MDRPPLQHCFAPVIRRDTRLVILGSLPGRLSLEAGRYYAHPRNQFWRLVGAVIGRDLAALDYDARLETLLDARIGLWDTVAAGRRAGSLDADLRLEESSDLPALIGRLPELRALGLNGGTAARIARRRLGARSGDGADEGPDPDLVDLPSSSPAYTLPFAAKLHSWAALRAYL